MFIFLQNMGLNKLGLKKNKLLIESQIPSLSCAMTQNDLATFLWKYLQSSFYKWNDQQPLFFQDCRVSQGVGLSKLSSLG